MKAFSVDTGLDAETRDFYRQTLRVLTEKQVPFLVGGAYALGCYSGIVRHTKDLDLFLKPSDYPRALAVLQGEGLTTEVTDPVWLAKAFAPAGAFVDLIFRSGNGVSEVDDEWFTHAADAELLDLPVKLCPPEETIWSKGFIMERHRYDGPDVAHYLLACGKQFDWERLLRRFGEEWRVLLSHLILFGFIYPDERDTIPTWVLNRLLDKVRDESRVAPPKEKTCRGTLLSHMYFLLDVGPWGRRDGRFRPRGTLTAKEIEQWERKKQSEAPAILQEAGISLSADWKESLAS